MTSLISKKHTYDGSENSGIEGLAESSVGSAPVINSQLTTLLTGFQALINSSNSIAFSANTPSLKVFESQADAITLSSMMNSFFNITFDMVKTGTPLQPVVGYIEHGSGFERIFKAGTLNGNSYLLFWDADSKGFISFNDFYSAYTVYKVDDVAASADFISKVTAGTLVGDETFELVTGEVITSQTQTYDTDKLIPSESSAYVSYPVSGHPYLEITTQGVRVKAASTIDANQQGKVADAVAVHNALEALKSIVELSQNTQYAAPASGALTGTTNVAAALDAAATLFNSQTSSINTLNTNVGDNDTDISNLQTLIGDLATKDGTLSGATVIAIINSAAQLIADIGTNYQTSQGLANGATLPAIEDFIASGSTVLQGLQALAAEVKTIEGELTDTWGTVFFGHNQASNPLSADQLAGTVAVDTLVDYFGNNVDIAGYATANDTDVTFIISSGETGAVEDGVYNRDKTTGMISRASLLDESSEFVKGQVVQIGSSSAGLMAGWKFKLISDSEPTLGTDAIKYKVIDTNPTGDGTITVPKLAADVVADFAERPVCKKFAQVTIPANNVALNVTHNLELTTQPRIIEHFVDGSGNLTGVTDVASDNFEQDPGGAGVEVFKSSRSTDTIVTIYLTGFEL